MEFGSMCSMVPVGALGAVVLMGLVLSTRSSGVVPGHVVPVPVEDAERVERRYRTERSEGG